MRKIRINELARELEVKAHEILELLPELGVTEKKTHSSSIDEDVAIKLRRLYGHEVSDEAPDELESAPSEGEERSPVETVEAPVATEEAATPAAPAVEEEMTPEPAAETAMPGRAPRPAHPIRPPLAGSQPPAAQFTPAQP